jgi:hypothetical protein
MMLQAMLTTGYTHIDAYRQSGKSTTVVHYLINQYTEYRNAILVSFEFKHEPVQKVKGLTCVAPTQLSVARLHIPSYDVIILDEAACYDNSAVSEFLQKIDLTSTKLITITTPYRKEALYKFAKENAETWLTIKSPTAAASTDYPYLTVNEFNREIKCNWT